MQKKKQRHTKSLCLRKNMEQRPSNKNNPFFIIVAWKKKLFYQHNTMTIIIKIIGDLLPLFFSLLPSGWCCYGNAENVATKKHSYFPPTFISLQNIFYTSFEYLRQLSRIDTFPIKTKISKRRSKQLNKS